MTESAAEQWARELSDWAIPPAILESAPRRPFVFAPEMFAAPPPGAPQTATTTRRALEALPPGGSVLDVGCGGGAAAFALAPPAGRLIGADRQRDMVELFLQTASERGIEASGHIGAWPDISPDVPGADVVVCHNVLYNAPDIVAFARALESHARRRVVIEITHLHPQEVRKPLWRHFWDLNRPDGPSGDVAAAALREAGIDVNVEESLATARGDRVPSVEAALWCRQLCLPTERESEVAELIEDIVFPLNRLALWWDVGASDTP